MVCTLQTTGRSLGFPITERAWRTEVIAMPGHSSKGRWKDKEKQAWSKVSFMYMVYSSQPPCCNFSLRCLPLTPSMELSTASSRRDLLLWEWISRGGLGKKRRAQAQSDSPEASAPSQRGERRKEEGSTELEFKYSRSYTIEDKK